MIPGARLVLLGRQGAGKGTQCVRLARHYVVPHISTGDMLRTAVREGTDFGRKAKEYMDAGELLPDEVMSGIVAERLDKDDARNRGYVLDGFPRTVAQAESLDRFTVDAPLNMVIDLEVPEEIVLERLAGRRVCSDCGTNYAVQQPPRYNWTCDVCGGDVVQRDDDTEDAIRRRLALYDKETAPLIAYYLARDLLVTVDGLGPPDTVTARLVRAIDHRTRGPGRPAA
jgi:adenylate kinase